MSYLSKPDCIVLFDSSSSIDELKKIFQQEMLVITFDYESHKILSKNNMPHEISDNYLTENDLQTIQKKSYDLSKWYNETKIANLLEYKGVNTAQLFYVEFHYLLVPFLKKFVELTKILTKYSNAQFMASSTLYDMISRLTQSVRRLEKTKVKNEFLYDSIKFNLNNSLTLNISRTQYLRLKKMSERITHQLFGLKKKSTNSKSVLLMEFDTIRYEKLLSLLPKFSPNLVFFNRRRPAIWNLKSFSIIKKSKCSIATYYDIVDKNIENSIKQGILLIKSRINSLWDYESFFKSFFSINGISFWEIIKPALSELCEKRIIEAVQEIEITKALLEKFNFTSIVLWSENGFNEQIIINLAKRFNIPTVLLQHGLYDDASNAYEFNKFAGILPIQSDKFIAWGKIFETYAVNNGIQRDKIESIGSPIYDKIFDRKIGRSSFKEDYILLATSSPTKNIVYDLTVRTREKYETTIKRICGIISKMNKKLVIKLHPFQEEVDVTEITGELDDKITVIKKGDIVPLIESCEIFLTIDISTTILEAQILGKPVISISVKDYGFGDPEVFRSNSCIRTNPNDLEATLHHLLRDEDLKKRTVENGNKFVIDYLSNRGTASQEILNFLEKLQA